MTADAEGFVQAFLAHYASEYYDPQKAHEYYLQNRELKGRQSTSGLTVKYTTHNISKKGKVGKAVQKVNKAATDRRQQAWAYTKNQIDAARKGADKTAQQARQAQAKAAHEAAQQSREKISGQLRDYIKNLAASRAGDSQKISEQGKADLKKFAETQKAKTKKISDDAANEIANLPPIPKGISDDARASLIAERADKIAKIRQKAVDDLGSLVEETKSGSADIAAGTVAKRQAASADLQAQKQKGRDDANSSREVVSATLKTAVEKARVDYVARKELLKAQYDATAQKEYDAIKARV